MNGSRRTGEITSDNGALKIFRIISSLSCLQPLDHASVTTRSRISSAQAAWARCTAPRDTQLGRDVALKVLPEVVRRRSRTPRALRPRSAHAGDAESSQHRPDLRPRGAPGRRAHRALVMELVEGPTLADRIAARTDSGRRSAADRPANCRRAGGRARPGHHPSRSQAGQHQSPPRRTREGAGFRTGEGD